MAVGATRSKGPSCAEEMRLDEEAPRNRAEDPSLGARVRQASCDQQAKVLLGAEDAAGIVVGVRCDDHFGEELGDFLSGWAVQRRVESEHAAKRTYRVAGKGLCVRIRER